MTNLRHDCKASGVCFNDEHRLRFGVFDDCWMRNDWRTGWRQSSIRPMDTDFLIEQRGNFLAMEWKSSASVFEPSSGQNIAFRKLAAVAPFTVILVKGQAKTMTVERVMALSGGYESEIINSSLDGLKHLLREWSRWAECNPVYPLRDDKAVPVWLEGFLKESA